MGRSENPELPTRIQSCEIHVLSSCTASSSWLPSAHPAILLLDTLTCLSHFITMQQRGHVEQPHCTIKNAKAQGSCIP